MRAVAQTLPGIETVVWQKRGRFDKAAVDLADRHYSREAVGSPQVGGPGFLLVLVTPCERAVWISKRHQQHLFDREKKTRTTGDGFRGYRCGMFRNEGAGQSSDLIAAAVELTERLWGPSEHGWATYVRRSRVASANPGYCFKRAGWTLDRDFDHPDLVRLLL